MAVDCTQAAGFIMAEWRVEASHPFSSAQRCAIHLRLARCVYKWNKQNVTVPQFYRINKQMRRFLRSNLLAAATGIRLKPILTRRHGLPLSHAIWRIIELGLLSTRVLGRRLKYSYSAARVLNLSTQQGFSGICCEKGELSDSFHFTLS